MRERVYDNERTRSKKKSGEWGEGRGWRLEKESGRPSPASVRGLLAGRLSHAIDALMDATRTRPGRLTVLLSNHHIPAFPP